MGNDREVHEVTPLVDVWSFGVMAKEVFGVVDGAALGSASHVFDTGAFVGRCTACPSEYRPTFEDLVVEVEAVLEELRSM